MTPEDRCAIDEDDYRGILETIVQSFDELEFKDGVAALPDDVADLLNYIDVVARAVCRPPARPDS